MFLCLLLYSIMWLYTLIIKNKFFDGSSATIGKSINFFKKGFIDIGFFYLKEYKNNLFLTERYMFI